MYEYVFGVSLSEPRLVRCMAGSAVSARYNFAHNAMHIITCAGMIAGIRCHVSMVL